MPRRWGDFIAFLRFARLHLGTVEHVWVRWCPRFGMEENPSGLSVWALDEQPSRRRRAQLHNSIGEVLHTIRLLCERGRRRMADAHLTGHEFFG